LNIPKVDPFLDKTIKGASFAGMSTQVIIPSTLPP
jgi:hypothetical protein